MVTQLERILALASLPYDMGASEHVLDMAARIRLQSIPASSDGTIYLPLSGYLSIIYCPPTSM